VKWDFSVSNIKNGELKLTIRAEIDKNWRLYSPKVYDDGPLATEVNFFSDTLSVRKKGSLLSSKPLDEFDPYFFKNISFFKNEAEFYQTLYYKKSSGEPIKGEISYQVCDNRLCIFRTKSFSLSIDGKLLESSPNELKEYDLLKIDEITLDLINKNLLLSSTDLESKNQSFISIFLLGILSGLLALLTPCIFPMIPLTVSFFLKQNQSNQKGIFNAFLYGFFIIFIYGSLSLPFHLVDSLNPQILNDLSTSVFLNLIFFAVFIFFAFSFFGFYELTLPLLFSNKTESKSSISGVIGIFFMALTLALVSFSCTGPILGSLLVGSLSINGGAYQLTTGMLGFGISLALPFAILALFPNMIKNLPKSGIWMKKFKIVLGFIELALALKFLSNADLVSGWGLLKREVFIFIWLVLSLLLSLYLLGVFKNRDEKRSNIEKIFGLTSLIFSVYLLNGLVSKENNLKFVSGFTPPVFYSLFSTVNDCPLNLDCYKDFEAAREKAKYDNKPILIDFTGWACVNCRRVEENIWSNPEVYDILKNRFIINSLYVDDRKKLSPEETFNFKFSDGRIKKIRTVGEKWSTFQLQNFNSASQPYYIIIHPNGRILNYPLQYTSSVNKYRNWLNKGLDNYGL
jgi:thiol:disulfide interchange protein DsbD